MTTKEKKTAYEPAEPVKILWHEKSNESLKFFSYKMECSRMYNAKRDMGNQFSEPESSQSQPQAQQTRPQEKNSWEARPGPAERDASDPLNRAQSSRYSETQALTPHKPFEKKKFVPHYHEDKSKEADFSAGKSSFQKLGEQYYGGVSLDSKTRREAQTVGAQREASDPLNRAKSSKYSETQALTQQKRLEKKKFVPHYHEDKSKEADFSAGKSSFQKLGEQYYGGVSLDSKTRREAQTVAAQRETSPSQGYRGKAAEINKTVVRPRETQGLMPDRSLKELKLPNNYQEILKYADSAINTSSIEKLSEQLQDGVFLDQKTKRYWLDKSYRNCFMLYARALSISWSENKNYWRWVTTEDASDTMIDAAELKKVCWLEVHGRMDTKLLSPGVLYEVSFEVMLKDAAQGWEVPVNFRLVLPRGKKQEQKENLIENSRMQWIKIPVGQFVLSAQDIGEMEISMYENECGIWKQGLVIKGVVIEAKN